MAERPKHHSIFTEASEHLYQPLFSKTDGFAVEKPSTNVVIRAKVVAPCLLKRLLAQAWTRLLVEEPGL